ncbi:MAG: GNAT family N-acetyltransferase [Clostridia bacterium]|nr:GNAT family N-acetyltransferase [Clostridia bacterium]
MHTIRKAQEKDIPRILELLVQVNMVHHNGRPDLFRGPATKYSEEQLRKILADPATPVFVAVNEADTADGYVFGIHRQVLNDSILTDIKTLYIDDLCVDEKCRGSHIGSALFDYAVHYAREQGCYNVTLNAWCLNPAAIRFYEKLGMKPQKIGMETIL